jgi:hypothetical protein
MQKYINPSNTASMEYAYMVLQLMNQLPDDASFDMMNFLFGKGQ